MSELRGIGLDICGIARMAQQLDNTHFLQRILTKEEIAYLRSRGASAADTLAGLLSGLVYKALENKNRTLAVAVAAVVCPVVNTGVFLIGCLLFFMETIGGWADAMGFGANVGQYMIVGLVGANFIFELLFNVVLSPVVVRLIRIGKKEV